MRFRGTPGNRCAPKWSLSPSFWCFFSRIQPLTLWVRRFFAKSSLDYSQLPLIPRFFGSKGDFLMVYSSLGGNMLPSAARLPFLTLLPPQTLPSRFRSWTSKHNQRSKCLGLPGNSPTLPKFRIYPEKRWSPFFLSFVFLLFRWKNWSWTSCGAKLGPLNNVSNCSARLSAKSFCNTGTCGRWVETYYKIANCL